MCIIRTQAGGAGIPNTKKQACFSSFDSYQNKGLNMIKNKPCYRNTEKLLFRYFQRLKLLKHFSKPTEFIHDIIYESNASICDVGLVLNNLNLTDEQSEIIIKYCSKGHAPFIKNSNDFSVWIDAIHIIHNEFIKRNMIKGILYSSEYIC